MHLKIPFTEQQQYCSGPNVFDALNPLNNLELRPQPWLEIDFSRSNLKKNSCVLGMDGPIDMKPDGYESTEWWLLCMTLFMTLTLDFQG